MRYTTKGFKMARKTNKDSYARMGDIVIEQNYHMLIDAGLATQSDVEQLVDQINEARIFKKDKSSTVYGVKLPRFKYIIHYGEDMDRVEYAIDSVLRKVYSIEADDVEREMFKLEVEDHQKLVQACADRYAKIVAETKARRKVRKAKNR